MRSRGPPGSASFSQLILADTTYSAFLCSTLSLNVPSLIVMLNNTSSFQLIPSLSLSSYYLYMHAPTKTPKLIKRVNRKRTQTIGLLSYSTPLQLFRDSALIKPPTRSSRSASSARRRPPVEKPTDWTPARFLSYFGPSCKGITVFLVVQF